MTRTRHVFLIVAAIAASLPSVACAQFARAEDAVKYRQGLLFALNHHFTRIGQMANGRVPFDARVASENADIVAALAKLPGAGFVPASAPVSRGTKPELWTEAARFKEQNDRFIAETVKLAAAAKTGNLDQLKAAYAATATTCKACHDAYRSN